jgi:hypothetical protein
MAKKVKVRILFHFQVNPVISIFKKLKPDYIFLESNFPQHIDLNNLLPPYLHFQK